MPETGYNEQIWGPAWLWALGSVLFVAGIALTVWFMRMARSADSRAEPDGPLNNPDPEVPGTR